MEEATTESADTCVLIEDETQKRRAHCNHEWIGACAGFLTTTAFVPQVYRVYTTERTGVSVGMYCMFTVGVGLWIVYGISKRAHSLIFASCVTLALTLLILLRLL